MAAAVRPSRLPSRPPSFLPSSPSPSTSRRQQSNMSLSQTYFLAQVARHKLMNAARRPDRDLRVLTAHANMLDGLMADLAEAENEQEDWFNQAVSYANAGNTVTAFNDNGDGDIRDKRQNPTSDFDFDSDDDDDDDLYDEFDDDDDDDFDECGSDCSCSSGSDSGEDIVFMLDSHSRAVQRKRSISTLYNELNSTLSDAEPDEETDYAHYTRDSIQQPPELLHDPDEEESDDDSQPVSPRRNSFDFFATSSHTIGETLTSSEVGKETEVVQTDDDDEDVPLLGYCFSRSSVLHG
ncbi:hypothetical protein MGYG_08145 [Nannizzia gypsea CBS 118893]|uniref:Uncharacterized protein n=1 Tax=Arthroderma gypseum (strain ATCC MYA-4604 / CBS 118893) TaxID=535722 RepID=E4V559_ARTGP|nr:hypothetical protein MGYG_08145 [Nannizzia gypsea CBS 118893]EFR05133.1 hypothetical protein MGYG_08145 [Nannizzia gypsea CBS 118893]